MNLFKRYLVEQDLEAAAGGDKESPITGTKPQVDKTSKAKFLTIGKEWKTLCDTCEQVDEAWVDFFTGKRDSKLPPSYYNTSNSPKYNLERIKRADPYIAAIDHLFGIDNIDSNMTVHFTGKDGVRYRAYSTQSGVRVIGGKNSASITEQIKAIAAQKFDQLFDKAGGRRLKESKEECPFKRAIDDLFDRDEERSGLVIVDTDESEYRVRVNKDGVSVTSLSGTDERAKEIEDEIMDHVGDVEEITESIDRTQKAVIMEQLIESFSETGELDIRALNAISETANGDKVDEEDVNDVRRDALVKQAVEASNEFEKRKGYPLDFTVTVKAWLEEAGVTDDQFQKFAEEVKKCKVKCKKERDDE